MTPERIDILIVDDKPANLLALEAILNSPAYRLVRANSGLEAIQHVAAQTFAAILLDVEMPGLDGYETARRIKQLENGRDVPIVFVTAVFQENEDARRGYEAGGIDFFPKPLDPSLLRTKIKLYGDLFVLARAAREHGKMTEAVQKTRALERKLEAILRTILEGVVVADRDGRVVEYNEEAGRLFGSAEAMPFLRRGQYVGAHPETGDVIPSNEWPLIRTLQSGEPTGSELTEISGPEGRKLIVMNSACPLRGEDGELLGAVAAFKELPNEPLPGIASPRAKIGAWSPDSSSRSRSRRSPRRTRSSPSARRPASSPTTRK